MKRVLSRIRELRRFLPAMACDLQRISPIRVRDAAGPRGARNRLARHHEAVGRLHRARRCFEHSMIAVRRAALDHVDSQHLLAVTLQVTLQATLDRVAADARS